MSPEALTSPTESADASHAGGRSAKVARRAGVVVGIGAVAFGLTALAGFLMPGIRDSFDVHIVNDGRLPMVVAQCVGDNGSCSATGDPYTLGSGDFAVAGDAVNVANPWVIRSESGAVLGCVDLVFSDYPQSTPSVAVSTATHAQCG